MLPSRLNPARLKFGRTLLVVGLLGLALAACGRKGPLEPPPNGLQAKEAAEAQKNGQKVNTDAPLVPDRKLWIDHLI